MGAALLGTRRPWVWTPFQLDKLNKVKATLDELKDYKPLTLRQIYYQLVGKGFIENNKSEYVALSKLLKWARIDRFISWKDIEDRGRVYHDLSGWYNSERFVRASLKQFLTGYRRDLLQTQDKYIELWIEKDALSSVFTKAARPYTVPVVVCRGFSSVSFLNNFKNRLTDYQDKQPVLLYFGDFDPSGMAMLDTMRETFETEMDVNNIIFKRIALSESDISKYKLPHSPDALKDSDTRAKDFISKFGRHAVELDALRPDVLERKIKKAIEHEIDIDAFNAEVGREAIELDKLTELKQRVENIINSGGGL